MHLLPHLFWTVCTWIKKTNKNCLLLLCWTSSAHQRATGQTASAQGESCFDPLEWILAFAVALRKGRARALIFSVVFITLWITFIAAAKQLAAVLPKVVSHPWLLFFRNLIKQMRHWAVLPAAVVLADQVRLSAIKVLRNPLYTAFVDS